LYTLITAQTHVATEENQQKDIPKRPGLANKRQLVPGLAFANGSKMKLGLVTYQWGKDWDIPRSSKIARRRKFTA